MKRPSAAPSQSSSSPSISPSMSPTAGIVSCSPKARRVKISSVPGQYIQLFHVQVFSTTIGPNISADKTANQSTTSEDDTPAYSAIDQEKYSFSRTDDSDPDPWWELDLGDMVPVQTVYIAQHMCKYAPSPELCYCHLGYANITLLDDASQTVASYNLGMVCAMRHVISFDSQYNCTGEDQSATSLTSSLLSTGLTVNPPIEALPAIPTNRLTDGRPTPSLTSIPSSLAVSSEPTVSRPVAATYFQSPILNPDSRSGYLFLGTGICSNAFGSEFIGLRYKCAQVDLSGCASVCSSLGAYASHNGLTLLTYGCICHFDSDAVSLESPDLICWDVYLPNKGAFGEVVSSIPLGKSSACYKRTVSLCSIVYHIDLWCCY